MLGPVKHKSLSRGPCLTDPAPNDLPSARVGWSAFDEHRDGSCGATFLLGVSGPVVERADFMSCPWGSTVYTDGLNRFFAISVGSLL